MQLNQLAIGLTAAIATITITQSAVWSFTSNNSSSSIRTHQLALEPVTTGGAARQDVDATSQDGSGTQQPTVLKKTDVSPESKKMLNINNVNRYRPTNCQLIPQTSGGNVMNQLNALSKCYAGN
jgi:hypothetical protein